MFNNIPERRLVPPDPPSPIGECAYCGEELFPGQEIVEIHDEPICKDNYCIENYVKENLKITEEIDQDYTLIDYAYDYYIKVTRMPTKEEMRMASADY